jgi:hypothetical protein
MMAIRKIQLTVGNSPIGTAITWSYPNSDGKTYLIPTYQMAVEGTDGTGAPKAVTFEVIRFGVYRKTATSAPTVVGLAQAQTHKIKAWLPDYTVHSARSLERGAWQVYDNFLIHDGPDFPMVQSYATAGCIEICGSPEGFVKFNELILELAGSTKGSRNEQLAEIGASGKMVITYLPATRPPLKVQST